MAGQANIKVDAGTGSPVDFSVTNSAANYRQAVTIGDPLVDANYASVGAQGLNVTGTMVISNSPTVILGSGSNVVGTVSLNGTPTVVLGTGSNVVGTVSLNGTPSVALAAGSNIVGTISVKGGQVAASAETGTVFNGLVAITPSFGSIGFSATGNNVLVGTIATKIIRVLALNLLVGTATNVYLTDGSGGAPMWGSSTNTGQFAANSGIVLPFNQAGWFQTSAGNALIANISAASSVAGSLVYIAI